jgi:D-proline reductase (dithiol) PrdB
VGLVQRRIEAARFSTITLSTIPALTSSVGVPRVAGLERPCGLNVADPGDRAGQTATLRATLMALSRIASPGGVVDLPMGCAVPPAPKRLRPPQVPPIARFLMAHPWAFPRFVRRDPPEPDGTSA